MGRNIKSIRRTGRSKSICRSIYKYMEGERLQKHDEILVEKVLKLSRELKSNGMGEVLKYYYANYSHLTGINKVLEARTLSFDESKYKVDTSISGDIVYGIDKLLEYLNYDEAKPKQKAFTLFRHLQRLYGMDDRYISIYRHLLTCGI